MKINGKHVAAVDRTALESGDGGGGHHIGPYVTAKDRFEIAEMNRVAALPDTERARFTRMTDNEWLRHLDRLWRTRPC